MKCVRSVAAPVAAVSLLLLSDTPAAQTQTPSGEQKTLVIVAEFIDQPMSCSVETVRSTVFDSTLSVNALLRNNSADRIWLSGDVVGPVLLDRASTDPCSLSGLAMDAEAAASAAGADIGAYPRRVYVMPPNSCGAGGHGTLGGNPSQAWVFSCEMPGVYAHNLGHNLGMSHAASAAPLPEEEYGDPSDPMAFGSNRLPGFNAPHRHQMGWLAPSALVDVSTDADLAIAALDIDAALAAAPQVLRIRKPDSGDFYYVSYRKAQGFDQYMDSRFYERLSVHRHKGDGSSTTTYLVSRLADGETFTDSVNGISVTLLNRGSGVADVRVRFTEGSCQEAMPVMSLAPATQDGSAGATLTYELTLTNMNAGACGATSFALDRVVPAGWTGTLSSSQLTLAAGASAKATVRVTSASSALTGQHTFRVEASGTSPAHESAITATYRVVAAGDTQPPSTPGSLSAQVRSKRINLSWTPAADNVGVAGYRVWRDGAVIATVQGTSWSDPGGKAGQSHAYQVQAYDAAGNQSGLSSTATVSIGGRRK